MNGLYPSLIDRMEAYLMSQMAAQGGIPPNFYSIHGEYIHLWLSITTTHTTTYIMEHTLILSMYWGIFYNDIL